MTAGPGISLLSFFFISLFFFQTQRLYCPVTHAFVTRDTAAVEASPRLSCWSQRPRRPWPSTGRRRLHPRGSAFVPFLFKTRSSFLSDMFHL